MALSEEDIEAIADRVVHKLVAGPAPMGGDEHLTVAQVADRLGVNPSYVYANAQRLGGYKLGDGKRGRWRFDPRKLPAGASITADRNPSKRRGRRGPRRTGVADPTFGGLFSVPPKTS